MFEVFEFKYASPIQKPANFSIVLFTLLQQLAFLNLMTVAGVYDFG